MNEIELRVKLIANFSQKFFRVEQKKYKSKVSPSRRSDFHIVRLEGALFLAWFRGVCSSTFFQFNVWFTMWALVDKDMTFV